MKRVILTASVFSMALICMLMFVLPASHGEDLSVTALHPGLDNIKRFVPDIEKQFIKNNRPAVSLKDKRVIFLVPPAEAEMFRRMTPITLYDVPEAVAMCVRDGTAPERVDLSGYSIFPKNQGGRGTCVTFAVLAAVEARYKRLGMNVDLSEQFGNHLQKMAHLRDILPASENLRENQLGAWGGNHSHYMVAMLHRYRVPEERFLSYIPDGSYEDTNEPGDSPRLDWRDASVTQGQIDDFNLATANLPQVSLENAKYGITRYRLLTPDEENITNYECILAAGYEVIFMVPAHSMLMVGYDRSARVFYVKNSWNERRPIEISYDNIERDVSGSAYIIDVERSIDSSYRLEHMFLGRWKMDHDGWQGVLDINRVSQFFDRSSLNGHEDRRLGTYFNHEGKAFRVNGTIDGNKIEFYIDWGSPNLNYGTLHGKKFTAYLFSRERTYLAGSLRDINGHIYGFYATKQERLRGNPSPGDRVTLNSYIGTWSMNHDGWRGALTIRSVSRDGLITGTYLSHDGRTLNITGNVNTTNNRVIRFSIPFEAAAPQVFDGYMYSWERGIISGTTIWSGRPFGFVASRQ